MRRKGAGLAQFIVIALLLFGLIAGQAWAACESLRTYGNQWSGAGQLSAPRGVAIDSKGNSWVADSSHSRVQEFNSKGEFVAQFGVASPGGVVAIALEPEGNIWVIPGSSVGGASTIRKYSPAGEVLLSFGSQGSGNGQFGAARGIAVDSAGNVYVLDKGVGGVAPPRVQKFNSKGEYQSQFGSKGTGNGQFEAPEGIAVDSEGNVLVADTGNNRVQEFNSAGEFVRKYGSEGTGNGQFKSPQGIAIDSEGRVQVVDSGNNRVQRFSSKGAYQAQFGAFGSNAAQLSGPIGIAIDSEGHIRIADTGNDRVQEFGGC